MHTDISLIQRKALLKVKSRKLPYHERHLKNPSPRVNFRCFAVFYLNRYVDSINL